MGVGAAVELDENQATIVSGRVALGAVAPTPLLADAVSRSLVGQPANDTTFANAAELARELISPITDMRGTQEYRYHVTGVLVERVLRAAVSRARGEEIDHRPGH